MEIYYEKYMELDRQIMEMVPYVENVFHKGIKSVNAYIGNMYQTYMNVKQVSIATPDEFKSLYFSGWAKEIQMISNLYCQESCKKHIEDCSIYILFNYFMTDKKINKYVMLFLERSFYKRIKEYSRVKPKLEEILWIGDNRKILGIGVTPRFRNGAWENDKSEIRKTPFEYWTVGHILSTGLLIPDSNQKIEFTNKEELCAYYVKFIDDYCNSVYESKIARKYVQYLNENNECSEIPFLIPQFRYGGLESKHRYRLDFLIIDPKTQKKYGFEISPYSTHSGKELYEKDNEKRLAFFNDYGITCNSFTNSQLNNIDDAFAELKVYLKLKYEYKNILDVNLYKLDQLANEIGVLQNGSNSFESTLRD